MKSSPVAHSIPVFDQLLSYLLLPHRLTQVIGQSSVMSWRQILEGAALRLCLLLTKQKYLC